MFPVARFRNQDGVLHTCTLGRKLLLDHLDKPLKAVGSFGIVDQAPPASSGLEGRFGAKI
jgi:hypothetical protein